MYIGQQPSTSCSDRESGFLTDSRKDVTFGYATAFTLFNSPDESSHPCCLITLFPLQSIHGSTKNFFSIRIPPTFHKFRHKLLKVRRNADSLSRHLAHL